MIADWDIDVLQGYRKGIRVCDITKAYTYLWGVRSALEFTSIIGSEYKFYQPSWEIIFFPNRISMSLN